MAGFRNTWRDTNNQPPPQDNDAGDHGEQVPEDDELDTRPEDNELDTRHSSMKHVVDSVCSKDTLVRNIFFPEFFTYLELFMSCPKDELHQWLLSILGIS